VRTASKTAEEGPYDDFRILTSLRRRIELLFAATLPLCETFGLGQVGAGQPDLPNDNFDTGEATGPGKYRLNDETHANLLDALARQNFSGASPEVRAELLEFFAHPDAPYATKRKPKEWAKVQAELEQLRKAPSPVVAGDADDPSRHSTGENLGLRLPSE
jgi:hypothetical protein